MKQSLFKGKNVQDFNSNGVSFTYHATNRDLVDEISDISDINDGKPIIIWAHGWGHSHQNWSPLIAPLENKAHHIALDFPGFGNSPPPPEDWGTEHYADAIAVWLKDNNFPPVLWVGHSFGCRIGLQIAARHPECIKAMSLISGAGLKRKRPIHTKINLYLRVKLFKLLKKSVPNGNLKENLMSKFVNADYLNSGAMRKNFVRIVNEDLTPQAEKVTCPTTLIYGENDTETPPEFGERFSRLIPNSRLFLLDGQDHYSVLQDGRHQVIKLLSDFIEENR